MFLGALPLSALDIVTLFFCPYTSGMEKKNIMRVLAFAGGALVAVVVSQSSAAYAGLTDMTWGCDRLLHDSCNDGGGGDGGGNDDEKCAYDNLSCVAGKAECEMISSDTCQETVD